MMTLTQHYLLFSEASRDENDAENNDKNNLVQWRFVLQEVLTNRQFSASGTEPTACSERLELLAVVRALESLDGPSRVTLVTKSRYVSRGLKRGLPQWRERQWKWERFGKLRPVRDDDLWRRVDGALKFHELDCRLWQFGSPFETAGAAPSSEEIPVNPRRRRRIRVDGSGRPGLVVAAKERLKRATEKIGSITSPEMAGT